MSSGGVWRPGDDWCGRRAKTSSFDQLRMRFLYRPGPGRGPHPELVEGRGPRTAP